MCSYPSIQAFARRVESDLSRIDIVLLNAGVLKYTFNIIESTGHEECLQVNYLSTVLLVILLLPVLKAKGPPGEPARLTIVSASWALSAKFPFRDKTPLLTAFDDPKTYDGDQKEDYSSGKLLGHMFLWKFVDYVSPDDVILNLADPAWCKTGLSREVTGMMKVAGFVLGGALARSPKVGASCFVDAIINKGKESHGCFLMSWKIMP